MPRKANPAFLKPHKISPQLEAVVGKGPMSRPQIVKQLWEYIHAKNLQNPKVKINIILDDKMKAVFGDKKEITMFEMNKLVGAHLLD
ncbi:MAG TPA: SWIB/MDM2 domain-containing protein [Candidatus Magasanikbacteria bacterium]|nr:SWIB/MDM2 domain-containing protein [Candidatus Magasanikbacteria bacterium]